MYNSVKQHSTLIKYKGHEFWTATPYSNPILRPWLDQTHRCTSARDVMWCFVWCAKLRWERLRMGLKARLIWVSKIDKHTPSLSYWGGVTLISDHTHTSSDVQVVLSSYNKWECQKPILILNEQLYPNDGAGKEIGWWGAFRKRLEFLPVSFFFTNPEYLFCGEDL